MRQQIHGIHQTDSDSPRLLDLFCGAGGMAKGFQRAGFYVVGVDIAPQPNYCGDEFHQADALTFALDGFDAIHASPPCQANIRGLGAVNRLLGRSSRHKDVIPEVRARLIASGLPYVIENVEGAQLHNPIKLCGSSFGLAVRRHRLFESNVAIMALPCAHHLQTERRYWTSFGHDPATRFSSTVVQVYGNGSGHEHWPEAMGIDWMTVEELKQAIPPAYAEHIGHYLMAALDEPPDVAFTQQRQRTRADPAPGAPARHAPSLPAGLARALGALPVRRLHGQDHRGERPRAPPAGPRRHPTDLE